MAQGWSNSLWRYLSLEFSTPPSLKKEWPMEMVVDFRMLNSVTRKDSFPVRFSISIYLYLYIYDLYIYLSPSYSVQNIDSDHTYVPWRYSRKNRTSLRIRRIRPRRFFRRCLKPKGTAAKKRSIPASTHFPASRRSFGSTSP